MKNRRFTFGLLTVALTSTVLLSSCSHNEPEPFKTPAPPASSAPTSVVKDGNFMGENGLGSNPPGIATPGKAFGVDTSKVEIPKDVSDVWGEQATSGADDALAFWQVALAIQNRWTSETPNADDYRAVEPLMTVPAWDRLYAAAQKDPAQSIASDLVPGRNTDSTIAGIKIKAQTPMVLTPQNVTVSLAQDENKFGDNNARLKVQATVPMLVTNEEGTFVTVQDQVTVYMLSYESGWQVDNWDAGILSKA